MKAQEWKFIIYKLLDNTYKYYGLSIREDSYQVEIKKENILDISIKRKVPFVFCLKIKKELEKQGCKVKIEYPQDFYYKLEVDTRNTETESIDKGTEFMS